MVSRAKLAAVGLVSGLSLALLTAGCGGNGNQDENSGGATTAAPAGGNATAPGGGSPGGASPGGGGPGGRMPGGQNGTGRPGGPGGFWGPGRPGGFGGQKVAENATGDQIFQQKCQMCHGAGGKGGRAPSIAGGAGKSDGELFKIIHDGKDRMPSFAGQLSDAQIKKVIATIKQYK